MDAGVDAARFRTRAGAPSHAATATRWRHRVTRAQKPDRLAAASRLSFEATVNVFVEVSACGPPAPIEHIGHRGQPASELRGGDGAPVAMRGDEHDRTSLVHRLGAALPGTGSVGVDEQRAVGAEADLARDVTGRLATTRYARCAGRDSAATSVDNFRGGLDLITSVCQTVRAMNVRRPPGRLPGTQLDLIAIAT